jgi:hypothetical protein
LIQYSGVCWDENKNKWKAYLNKKETGMNIQGYYNTELEAAIAVNKLCIELNVDIINPGIEKYTTKTHKVTNKVVQTKKQKSPVSSRQMIKNGVKTIQDLIEKNSKKKEKIDNIEEQTNLKAKYYFKVPHQNLTKINEKKPTNNNNSTLFSKIKKVDKKNKINNNKFPFSTLNSFI